MRIARSNIMQKCFRTFIAWPTIVLSLLIYCVYVNFLLLECSKSNDEPQTGLLVPLPSQYQFLTTAFPDIQLAWNAKLDLLTINGLPVIWTFYYAPNLPDVYRLCLLTLRCQNEPLVSAGNERIELTGSGHAHVQLVSDNDLLYWLPTAHNAIKWLAPDHKLDYFKTRILEEYGGMYVDIGAVALRPASHLFDKLNAFDFVDFNSVWEKDEAVNAGVLGPVSAHHPVLVKWTSMLHLLLDDNLKDLRARWEEEAEYPLSDKRNLLQSDTMSHEAYKMFNDSYVKYYSIGDTLLAGKIHYAYDTSLNYLITIVRVQQSEFLFWSREGLEQHIATQTQREFFDSDSLLAEVLALAFTQCQARLQNFSVFDADTLIRPETFEIKNGVNAPRRKNDAILRNFIAAVMTGAQ